ncbi:MAG: hypothetical protein Q4P24_10930 [Rhodobacterales bacterium]|nr:hypothetical protein [Rhodobacterales bacterium]
MTISRGLLGELLKGCARPEDLLGDAGLMKELEIRLMERMPGVEPTAHSGHEDGKDRPRVSPTGGTAHQPGLYPNAWCNRPRAEPSA